MILITNILSQFYPKRRIRITVLFHTQGPLSIFTLKKALALNLARIDFEVFWSLVKHHRHSFPGLGTVLHSPSLEEVQLQDEAASNINNSIKFSKFVLSYQKTFTILHSIQVYFILTATIIGFSAAADVERDRRLRMCFVPN